MTAAVMSHVFDELGRKRGRHGTASGYTNGACRCDPCTWAWASYRRGDRPGIPEPVWLDDWLANGGSL